MELRLPPFCGGVGPPWPYLISGGSTWPGGGRLTCHESWEDPIAPSLTKTKKLQTYTSPYHGAGVSPMRVEIYLGPKMASPQEWLHHSLTLLGTKISLAASPAAFPFRFFDICDHCPWRGRSSSPATLRLL